MPVGDWTEAWVGARYRAAEHQVVGRGLGGHVGGAWLLRVEVERRPVSNGDGDWFRARCRSGLLGLFCGRFRGFKGKSLTWGGHSGLFCKRSGVLKGIPSLCKCYNACKVLYRCESGGIAVKAGPTVSVPL